MTLIYKIRFVKINIFLISWKNQKKIIYYLVYILFLDCLYKIFYCNFSQMALSFKISFENYVIISLQPNPQF